MTTLKLTPLATVKERFESKEKLVAAVKTLMTDELWVARLSEDRGGAKGIDRVSNAKLLRLHDTLTEVKDKLVDAVLEAQARAKDANYKQRLEGYTVPRLYDLYKSASKKSG